MKSVSKLACLFGWLLLWSAFVIGMTNITQWAGEPFTMPTMNSDVIKQMQSHRVHLTNLWLWIDEDYANYARLAAWDSNLNVLNGLFVWGWNASSEAALVVVWWWDNNTMNASSAWIAGWSNNTISANNSAIGGWANNIVSWENGVVAWWSGNSVLSGWGVVVWWWNNNSDEYWVVVWGFSNSAGKYGLAFGHSSRWGERSFSWNDWTSETYWTNDNSAYIGASGWVLIWTYKPILGVNLVVSGAVKIWWEYWEWRVWEVKMVNGCFYAHDGSKWHVLGKSSANASNCSTGDLAEICEFGNTRLWEWDQAIWYKDSYAPNCNNIMAVVTCGSDGNLDPAEYVYPYCYNLSD